MSNRGTARRCARLREHELEDLARPTRTANWREMPRASCAPCEQQERLLEACPELRSEPAPAGPVRSSHLAEIVADALRAHDRQESRASCRSNRRGRRRSALLERLAANLVSNAIRHNVYGGRIELATYTRSERAILVVANTGPLVPNGDLERLFQPSSVSARPEILRRRFGLGLAIVEAIATAHEARLWRARARPGGGLEIRVSFCALRGVPAGDAL